LYTALELGGHLYAVTSNLSVYQLDCWRDWQRHTQ